MLVLGQQVHWIKMFILYIQITKPALNSCRVWQIERCLINNFLCKRKCYKRIFKLRPLIKFLFRKWHWYFYIFAQSLFIFLQIPWILLSLLDLILVLLFLFPLWKDVLGTVTRMSLLVFFSFVSLTEMGHLTPCVQVSSKFKCFPLRTLTFHMLSFQL